MHARSTTINAAQGRLDEGIAYVRDEVMPAVRDMAGCTGLSMMVDRGSGRCIVTTAWQDEESLRASDLGVRPLRDRAAGIFGGQAQVDVWEIASLHREGEAGEGAGVRASWFRLAPDRCPSFVDDWRGTTLARVQDLEGFRSASMFLDRRDGRVVTSVTYDSRAALERTRHAADALRRSVAQEYGAEVLEVAEFDLVLAHLHVPELV